MASRFVRGMSRGGCEAQLAHFTQGASGSVALPIEPGVGEDAGLLTQLYYSLKPFVPRGVQLAMRRWYVARRCRHWADRWPIWEVAGTPPEGWGGWPEGKQFALVLTHDVEWAHGMERALDLAELEAMRGLRSAFAFVPERYVTPPSLRRALMERGFDVMVHGLVHDGKLFRNRQVFEARARRINRYLADWGTRGFASPSALHHLPWIAELDIDYDVSTFDTDPFEPQRCGIGTIFPFWVQAPDGSGRGYVELPYTLVQDFSLFILMREPTDAIWRRKLDWIAQRGGMALIKTHPDYMRFEGDPPRAETYPVARYTEFLDYVGSRYGDRVWVARPSEVARFWREQVGASDASPLPWRETFCPACRAAHAQGWLHRYPNGAGLRAPAAAEDAIPRTPIPNQEQPAR